MIKHLALERFRTALQAFHCIAGCIATRADTGASAEGRT